MKPHLLLPRRISRRTLLGVSSTSCACVCLGSLWPSRAEAVSGDPYPLDDLSRTIPARGRVACPKVELLRYRGDTVPYAQAALIYTEFKPRLQAMERIIAAAGKATYGRAPKRLVHLGTYNCRRIAAYPTWLSEHGLGNAIDVSGFDFGSYKQSEPLPESLPPSLRRPFSVRIKRHWKPGHSAEQKLHASFLRKIIRELLSRPRVFRVLLGPGYPGHHDHFHFDCAPFRMVEGFDGL